MAHRRFPWRLALLALGLAAACSNYSAIEPGGRRTVGDAYSVAPQKLWSRSNRASLETWTIDGRGLNTMTFWADVTDGEALLPERDTEDADIPVFRARMRASDVAQMVAATVQARNEGDVEVVRLRPSRFGRLDGFRFGLRYTAPNGLEMRAMAKGAVTPNDGLHLMLYSGAVPHHFGVHRSAVEAMFGSVKLVAEG